jgi:MFS family permease
MSDPSIQTPPGITSQPESLPPPIVLPGGTTPKAAMLLVFLVVFIDLLGFGIVLPLLPLYGDDYLHAFFGAGKDTPKGGMILGLLMSSFSLMQFIFAPIWGRVSDRVGRRPILLIGLGGSVVFYALFGFASDLDPATSAGLALFLLFAARIGQGIAGATIATAQAVIADCTPPDKRRHGMALIGAAFGIGFTFGPLLAAGALALFPQYRGATGYLAAGLSLVALMLGLKKLPETRTLRSAAFDRKWIDVRAFRSALSQPVVGAVVLTFFLATLGFGAFETTLAMMNRDLLGLPEKRNVLLFAYVGFVLMLTQGVIYRRLAKRVTETTFMAVGIVFMGGGVAFLGWVNWHKAQGGDDFAVLLSLMMAGMTFAVMGFAFLTPSAQSLVSRGTSKDKQGEVLGVNQSAASMARILGPMFGLTLYKATPDHLLPYGLGAVLLLAMLPMIPRIRRGVAQLTVAEEGRPVSEPSPRWESRPPSEGIQRTGDTQTAGPG